MKKKRGYSINIVPNNVGSDDGLTVILSMPSKVIMFTIKSYTWAVSDSENNCFLDIPIKTDKKELKRLVAGVKNVRK